MGYWGGSHRWALSRWRFSDVGVGDFHDRLCRLVVPPFRERVVDCLFGIWGTVLDLGVQVLGLQGYLAHKKPRPSRTLQ